MVGGGGGGGGGGGDGFITSCAQDQLLKGSINFQEQILSFKSRPPFRRASSSEVVYKKSLTLFPYIE